MSGLITRSLEFTGMPISSLLPSTEFDFTFHSLSSQLFHKIILNSRRKYLWCVTAIAYYPLPPGIRYPELCTGCASPPRQLNYPDGSSHCHPMIPRLILRSSTIDAPSFCQPCSGFLPGCCPTSTMPGMAIMPSKSPTDACADTRPGQHAGSNQINIFQP